MNNPFERDRTASATAVNNPFDTNPTSARNRFPDISQASLTPASPLLQQDASSSWPQQTDLYSPMTSQHQIYPSFMSNGSSQYASRSPFGSPQTGSFQPSPSMYSASGFAAGVASGGSYTSGLASPSSAIYSNFNGLSGSPGMAGYGVGNPSLGASPYTPDASKSSLHPQLSQFDPLSPSGAGQTPFGQQGYQQGATGQFQSQSELLDPGTLIWHPRNPGVGVQVVTGFNGQATVQAHIRPHQFAANDHPRSVIATHRVELEQWDQYGWRQSLNSLESLRIAWEHLRDDVSRLIDNGAAAPQEKAIYRKMKQEATEKIDDITAAYLQMQEVYSSYRQSPDPSSKKRVRECLNAGLRSLPDWP